MTAVIEARHKFAGKGIVELGTEVQATEDILKLKAGDMKINVNDMKHVNVFNGRVHINYKNEDNFLIGLPKSIISKEENWATVRFKGEMLYVKVAFQPDILEKIRKAMQHIDDEGFMKLDAVEDMVRYHGQYLGLNKDYKQFYSFLIKHKDEIAENAVLLSEIEKLLEKNQIVKDFIEATAPRLGEIELSLKNGIFTGKGNYQGFKDVVVTVTNTPETPTLHLFLGGSEDTKALTFRLGRGRKLGPMEMDKGFEGRIDLQELGRDFNVLLDKPQMRRWLAEEEFKKEWDKGTF